MLLNTMVKRLSALIGSNDLTDWESEFMQSVAERTRNGDNTTSLTERQIEVLERLMRKHFGDA